MMTSVRTFLQLIEAAKYFAVSKNQPCLSTLSIVYSIYSSALSCVSRRLWYCTITIQSRLLPRILEKIPLNAFSIGSSLPSAQAKSSYA